MKMDPRMREDDAHPRHPRPSPVIPGHDRESMPPSRHSRESGNPCPLPVIPAKAGIHAPLDPRSLPSTRSGAGMTRLLPSYD